jgi:hypothetical protein
MRIFQISQRSDGVEPSKKLQNVDKTLTQYNTALSQNSEKVISPVPKVIDPNTKSENLVKVEQKLNKNSQKMSLNLLYNKNVKNGNYIEIICKQKPLKNEFKLTL